MHVQRGKNCLKFLTYDILHEHQRRAVLQLGISHLSKDINNRKNLRRTSLSKMPDVRPPRSPEGYCIQRPLLGSIIQPFSKLNVLTSVKFQQQERSSNVLVNLKQADAYNLFQPLRFTFCGILLSRQFCSILCVTCNCVKQGLMSKNSPRKSCIEKNNHHISIFIFFFVTYLYLFPSSRKPQPLPLLALSSPRP